MRIVVYGSASPDTPQAFKDASFELGKLLAQRGHVCVNGGGNTGCMGSLSDGCLGNGGQVVGVIHEMFVVDGEEHTGVSEMLVATGDGLADRKRLLMQGCEAIIALPGGVGTFDELWESVAEVSLGFKDLPVVCVNVDGYYDCFQKMLERAFADKLIYRPPNDLLGMESTARMHSFDHRFPLFSTPACCGVLCACARVTCPIVKARALVSLSLPLSQSVSVSADHLFVSSQTWRCRCLSFPPQTASRPCDNAEGALDWVEQTTSARRGQSRLNKFAARTQPPALGVWASGYAVGLVTGALLTGVACFLVARGRRG